MTRSHGPLTGTRILELGGIGPTPFCGMLLSDLGADVIRVDRPEQKVHTVLHRGRRSVVLDLKSPAGRDAARRIAATCDAVVEGFRPGVVERLGLGPADLRTSDPALVHGRMTGFGNSGPEARTPGHDINYIALSGVLHTIGTADSGPVPPLNLVGDFGGGGMLLALGVLSGILQARRTGCGDVIDCAMVDGAALLNAMTLGLLNEGVWQDERASNLLDGGAPWYRTYRCADGAHVAVGCVEPQFWAEFRRLLGTDSDPDFDRREERARWPRIAARLEAIFLTRSRADWETHFAGSQACVTPVLSMREAAVHPHNVCRRTFHVAGDSIHPMPAPRFRSSPVDEPGDTRPVGSATRDVLADCGFTEGEVDQLLDR
ncbi:CoA transferase [Pseudonocardia sp. C8]|uniref:CaiB/BaiF CoA transferase family protein n=1 Tax=Pseudonocardia sp. C8 TaxID=2762759 RepID=UPI0016434A6D|nr:CaiB/BaiF CoA-transferase family protein [Pseudonocardia sp. C8]MBC3192988.1 CoA transferase [Pseudonocardia sp. C8]